MGLGRREKTLLIIAIAVIAALVADRYILSPVLKRRSNMKDDGEMLRGELEQALSTIKRWKILAPQWEQMKRQGLSGDPSVTEGVVLRYIKDSSLKNDIVIASIQPERLPQETKVREIEFLLSGTGNMNSVTGFLCDMETAPIPLKLKTMQLGAADETGSLMTMQLKMSSIYCKEKTD
jgi:hypothetical protein